MSTKISVLTAVKNGENTIAALHESLAKQSYRDFEWIVADGLSTDSTPRLLEKFAAKDTWIKFRSESDFGFYDALNKAIERASGPYYVVAGADDMFDSCALEKYAEAAEKSSADVVLARVMRAGNVIGGFHPRSAWVGPASAFTGSHSVGMLFKKDLHTRFGMYSRRFPLLADSYFLKTLLRAGTVKFIEANFIAGVFAEGGLTSLNKLQILAETWQIQLLTEKFPLFQTFLFLGKLTVRHRAVLHELRKLKMSGSHMVRSGRESIEQPCSAQK